MKVLTDGSTPSPLCLIQYYYESLDSMEYMLQSVGEEFTRMLQAWA